MQDLIIIEYSPIQKAFHKTTLMDMLKNNLTNLITKTNTGYVPIGATKTSEEANFFIETVYDQLTKI